MLNLNPFVEDEIYIYIYIHMFYLQLVHYFNCEAWNPALESSFSPSSTLQASCRKSAKSPAGTGVLLHPRPSLHVEAVAGAF